MLQSCPSQGGNLLLNIGPEADGRLPLAASNRLEQVGRWLRVHGEACFGPHDRISRKLPPITNVGFWTLRNHTAWFWLARAWPEKTLALGGLRGQIIGATLLHDSARVLNLEQGHLHTFIHGLPDRAHEIDLGIAVLRLEFAEMPTQEFPYAYCYY